MQEKSTTFKKIIIVLTILVIILGIFFGVKFYNASKNPTSTKNTSNNSGSVPFQTRTTAGGEVVVTNPDQNIVNTSGTSSDLTLDTETEAPRLVQLWTAPVSGFNFIYKDIEIIATTSTTTVVATTSTSTKVVAKINPPKKTILKNQEFIYIWDRATGNIFENLASTTPVNRLSNNTMPRIEEAYFTGANTVLVRGLDSDNENVGTKSLTLTKESATSTISNVLEKSIFLYTKQIVISPDSKKVFYFTEKTGQGSLMNPDGTANTRIISTILTEWLSQFVSRNTIAATTKPSAYFPGYLFFINTNGSGNNTYILGEKYGFTTLVSPDGRKVLYSEIRNDQLETVIYDIKTKKEITLSQATLTDKCTWTTDSSTIYCAIPQMLALAPYPDVWYQGKTSFVDNIWSINPSTGEFEIVIGLQRTISNPIDAYNLKVSQNKKYLLFQDKYSLTLWKYNL